MWIYRKVSLLLYDDWFMIIYCLIGYNGVKGLGVSIKVFVDMFVLVKIWLYLLIVDFLKRLGIIRVSLKWRRFKSLFEVWEFILYLECRRELR